MNKIFVCLILWAFISCNTEKTSTQDNNKGRPKGEKKKNPNKQKNGKDIGNIYNNGSDSCTTCCDPLLEIDPRLLILDKQ